MAEAVAQNREGLLSTRYSFMEHPSRKKHIWQCNRHENQRDLSREKSIVRFGTFIPGAIYRLCNAITRPTTLLTFYQTIDVLIIDDIQEFAGVTKTQNNFFHIFNHLHQNGKQLILTSDRAPVLLQGIEERLLTRFKWGMVAELEKPTVELRKNILRNKIHRDGLQFPPEVIDYIAENVNESVRDLEGIVIAIMARSTIFNKEIDLDLAQHIVHGVVHNETKAVTIDDILKVVCKHFDLEPSAIHTKSRKREVVQARQIAMYLAKNHTDFSTSKIGKFIGNKDHATVLHACKNRKGQLEVDKSFSAEVQEIESLLKKKMKLSIKY